MACLAWAVSYVRGFFWFSYFPSQDLPPPPRTPRKQKIIEGLRGKFAKIAEDKGLPDGREEAAEQVFACAPTGVAALLCGGMTLHSLLGCGVPTVKDDFSKMNTKKIQVRWRTMKVLVRSIRFLWHSPLMPLVSDVLHIMFS